MEQRGVRVPERVPPDLLGNPSAPRSRLNAFKETYNLELLEYEVGNHEEVVEGLEALLEDVEEYRQLH